MYIVLIQFFVLMTDVHLAIQLLQVLERVDKYTVHLQKD